MTDHRLLFLKLGGSLITDKNQPGTTRLDVLDRLAGEIASALQENRSIRLVLGHGSGSFGHAAAKKHQTHNGVSSPDAWHGFSQVWLQASRLNRMVVEALHDHHLPAVAFPPSGAIISEQKHIRSWETTPIQAALSSGLLPVVYGDVAFDKITGGTILSTEILFAHLAGIFHPSIVLIAGIEPGVWADYPKCSQLVKEITPDSLPNLQENLLGSQSVDVTGGMDSKVNEMINLARRSEQLQVRIFSGLEHGSVQAALLGKPVGTLIHAPHTKPSQLLR